MFSSSSTRCKHLLKVVLSVPLTTFSTSSLNSKLEVDLTAGPAKSSTSISACPSDTRILCFSFTNPINIVTCAFLCHFNVKSIQNALHEPTRQRMENLLQYAIIICFLNMYLRGIGGYLYAGDDSVEGNILLNVPIGTDDGTIDIEQQLLFTCGRLGIGLTIVLALPLMVLPCRDSLLEIIDVWFHRTHHRSNNLTQNTSTDKQCCWNLFHSCNRNECIEDSAITTEVSCYN